MRDKSFLVKQVFNFKGYLSVYQENIFNRKNIEALLFYKMLILLGKRFPASRILSEFYRERLCQQGRKAHIELKDTASYCYYMLWLKAMPKSDNIEQRASDFNTRLAQTVLTVKILLKSIQTLCRTESIIKRSASQSYFM